MHSRQTGSPETFLTSLDLAERKKMLNLLMALGIPSLSYFIVRNLLIGGYLTAILLVPTFMLLILALPIQKRWLDNHLRYQSFLFIFFISLGAVLAYLIGVEGKYSKIPWFYIFPLLAFLALGHKFGFLLTAVLIFTLLFFNSLATNFEPILLPEIRRRFFASAVAITIVSYFMQRWRYAYKQELIEHHQKLQESERKLREGNQKHISSEAKYRALIETTDTGYLILDENGGVIDANQEYVRLSGHQTRHEIVGRNAAEWTAPHDCERYAQELKRCLEKGYIQNLEIDYAGKDGRIVPIEMNSKVVSPDNELRILSLCRDISVRRQAEDALRESEKRNREQTAMLETILDAIPDVLGVQDLEHRIIRYNKAGYDFLNSAPGDVIGKTCFQLIGREKPCEICATSEVYRTKQPARVEKYIPEMSMWLEIRAYPVFDEHNQLVKIIEHLRDISERKRTEKALTESMRRYQLLADNVTDVIWSLDMDLTFTYISPSVEKLRGYTPEEAVKMTLEKTFTPASYHKVIRKITEEIDRDGQPGVPPNRSVVLELDTTHRDGSTVPVEINASFLRDETGSPSGIIGITRDITERTQAEEALRESEAKFRSIFENKGTATGIYSEDSIIRGCNTVFEELCGYAKSEIIGKMKWSDFVAAEDLERMQKYHARRLSQGTSPPSQYECRIVNKSGERLTVIVNINLVGTDRIVSLTDITAWRQAVEERKQLQAKLIQAQKMEAIGTLAGGIAHNFNNILMGIQGRASLLMMDKNHSDPDIEHLKGIEDYVKNAVGLTRDLLGFARGGKYETLPTNLNTLIKHENSMFGRTKREIKIYGKYEQDLWPVEVDQGQIRQALLNLYVNAWQAMPGGGNLYVQTENITLDEEYVKHSEVAPGRYVKISVTDTGVGMDTATKDKIFDPFFSTKDIGEGSGLGLASLWGIVKNHGGFTNVYSEKGEGTTFHIYLPVLKKGAGEDLPLPEHYQIQYGRGKVLLVDDEEMILEVGKSMIEKLGYKVLTAGSGREALNLYAQHKQEIDLVILDLVMPGLGGGKTYERLREMDRDVRVILSSGYSVKGQAEKMLGNGSGSFIQKPFDVEALSIKVHEVLERDGTAVDD